MSEPRRILFVDDEQQVLDGLRDMLRPMRKKWRVDFAGSGEAALGELLLGRYDVIVSDVRMPGMDGVELLGRVQQLYPHTVRIVLSGHTELDAALRCATVAHQFLTKPCSSALLLAVIERACALRELIGDERLRAQLGKLGALTSPPGATAELARALESGSSPEEIGRLVESDPAMSAKVLQLVSSAFFGHAGRVRGVPHAVELLGGGVLRQLVAALVEAEAAVPESPAQARTLEHMRRHSLFAARIAARLCTDERMSADAFMAALLHCVGRLAVGADGDCGGAGNPVSGAYLLGLWGLPAPLVDAVAGQHLPRTILPDQFGLGDAVHCASALAREFDAAAAPEEILARLPALPSSGAPLEWSDLARAIAAGEAA